MNDLEKKVDEVVKMNNDLLFKFNEYVSKNEIDKMELQKQQIKMKDEFIKELEKIKSDLEEMTKSKKIQDDEIKYIKEQLKNIEESKKQNDKLFEEELKGQKHKYSKNTKISELICNTIKNRNDVGTDKNINKKNATNDKNIKNKDKKELDIKKIKNNINNKEKSTQKRLILLN